MKALYFKLFSGIAMALGASCSEQATTQPDTTVQQAQQDELHATLGAVLKLKIGQSVEVPRCGKFTLVDVSRDTISVRRLDDEKAQPLILTVHPSRHSVGNRVILIVESRNIAKKEAELRFVDRKRVDLFDF